MIFKRFNHEFNYSLFSKISFLNSKNLVFNLLIIGASFLVFIHYRNIFGFGFILLSLLFIFYKTRKFSSILIITIFIGIILCIYFLNTNTFKDLNIILSKKVDLRDKLINYINLNYHQKVSEFINLLLFNSKNYNSEIYQSLKLMNILQLFVVSGLHISLICTGINFIFRKIKYIGTILSIITTIIMWYFVGLSISCLRVLITLILKWIFKNQSSFYLNCLSGIIILFISPLDATSFSYYLSFVSILGICFINETISSGFLKIFSSNVLISIITMPLLIYLNKSYNLNGFIFNYIFGPLIITTFIVCLLFCWIPIFFCGFNVYILWLYDFLNLDIKHQMVNIILDKNMVSIIYIGVIVISNIVLLKFND